MKLLKKYKIAGIAAIALAALVVACEMVVEEINFPEDAKVNTEITFTVKLKLVTETDDNSNMVFALLAPKSWDLKNNASLTLTTEGYAAQGYAEVVNEPMSLIPDSETEKSTALSYPAAYQSKIGVMGTITLTTGADPIKFYLGCGFCGTTWGLDSESGEGRYTPNETAKIVTVYGEEGDPILDYTTTAAVSTTPSTFRYGDIFSVNFDASETQLEGQETVYLCGKAVLADGTEKLMEDKVDKALMEAVGETSYQRYIYPKDFFGLPADAEISEIYVWFSNADGSVISKDGEDGTLLSQAEQ